MSRAARSGKKGPTSARRSVTFCDVTEKRTVFEVASFAELLDQCRKTSKTDVVLEHPELGLLGEDNFTSLPPDATIFQRQSGAAELSENFGFEPDVNTYFDAGDDYKFEEALAELIDNCIEATKTNTASEGRRVEITLRKTDETLTIEDNGCGMTQEALKKWPVMGCSMNFGRAASGIVQQRKTDLMNDSEDSFKIGLTGRFSRYGYGGKAAAAKLGERVTVETRPKGSVNVHHITLDKEELREKSLEKRSWQGVCASRRARGDEREHFTRITIERANPTFLRAYSTENTRLTLAHTYHYYIHGPQGGRTLAESERLKPEFVIDTTNWIPVKLVVDGTDLSDLTKIHDLEHDYLSHGHNELRFDVTVETERDGVNFQENVHVRMFYYPYSQELRRETIPLRMTVTRDETEADARRNEEELRLREDAAGFEYFWQGRLIPEAHKASSTSKNNATMLMPAFVAETMAKRAGTGKVPPQCYKRIRGMVFLSSQFMPTKNKVQMQEDDPLWKEFKFAKKGRVDKKTMLLSNAVTTWLKNCHDTYDNEISVAGPKELVDGQLVYPEADVMKTKFKRGDMIHLRDLSSKKQYHGIVRSFMVPAHENFPVFLELELWTHEKGEVKTFDLTNCQLEKLDATKWDKRREDARKQKENEAPSLVEWVDGKEVWKCHPIMTVDECMDEDAYWQVKFLTKKKKVVARGYHAVATLCNAEGVPCKTEDGDVITNTAEKAYESGMFAAKIQFSLLATTQKPGNYMLLLQCVRATEDGSEGEAICQLEQRFSLAHGCAARIGTFEELKELGIQQLGEPIPLRFFVADRGENLLEWDEKATLSVRPKNRRQPFTIVAGKGTKEADKEFAVPITINSGSLKDARAVQVAISLITSDVPPRKLEDEGEIEVTTGPPAEIVVVSPSPLPDTIETRSKFPAVTLKVVDKLGNAVLPTLKRATVKAAYKHPDRTVSVECTDDGLARFAEMETHGKVGEASLVHYFVGDRRSAVALKHSFKFVASSKPCAIIIDDPSDLTKYNKNRKAVEEGLTVSFGKDKKMSLSVPVGTRLELPITLVNEEGEVVDVSAVVTPDWVKTHGGVVKGKGNVPYAPTKCGRFTHTITVGGISVQFIAEVTAGPAESVAVDGLPPQMACGVKVRVMCKRVDKGGHTAIGRASYEFATTPDGVTINAHAVKDPTAGPGVMPYDLTLTGPNGPLTLSVSSDDLSPFHGKINLLPGPPEELVVTQPPSAQTVLNRQTHPPIHVEVRDSYSNVIENVKGDVEIKCPPLKWNAKQKTSGGRAIFSGLVVKGEVGTTHSVDIAMQITAGKKSKRIKSHEPFEVVIGAGEFPAKLIVDPAAFPELTAGAKLPPVAVKILREDEVTEVNTDLNNMTLRLSLIPAVRESRKSGAAAAVATVDATVEAADGHERFIFRDVPVPIRAGDYHIVLRLDSEFDPVEHTRIPLTVVGGPAVQIIVTAPLTAMTGGSTFVTAAEVVDEFGNVAGESTALLTASIECDSATSDKTPPTLGGTCSVAANGGTAAFRDLSVGETGTTGSYLFRVTAPGLSPAEVSFNYTSRLEDERKLREITERERQIQAIKGQIAEEERTYEEARKAQNAVQNRYSDLQRRHTSLEQFRRKFLSEYPAHKYQRALEDVRALEETPGHRSVEATSLNNKTVMLIRKCLQSNDPRYDCFQRTLGMVINCGAVERPDIGHAIAVLLGGKVHWVVARDNNNWNDVSSVVRDERGKARGIGLENVCRKWPYRGKVKPGHQKFLELDGDLRDVAAVEGYMGPAVNMIVLNDNQLQADVGKDVGVGLRSTLWWFLLKNAVIFRDARSLKNYTKTLSEPPRMDCVSLDGEIMRSSGVGSVGDDEVFAEFEVLRPEDRPNYKALKKWVSDYETKQADINARLAASGEVEQVKREADEARVAADAAKQHRDGHVRELKEQIGTLTAELDALLGNSRSKRAREDDEPTPTRAKRTRR